MAEAFFQILLAFFQGILEAIGEIIIGLIEKPKKRKMKLYTVPIIDRAATFHTGRFVLWFGISAMLLTSAVVVLFITGIIGDPASGIVIASVMAIPSIVLLLSSLERLVLDDHKISHRNLFGAVTVIPWDQVVSIAKNKNGNDYVIHGPGKKKIRYLSNLVGFEQIVSMMRRKCPRWQQVKNARRV